MQLNYASTPAKIYQRIPIRVKTTLLTLVFVSLATGLRFWPLDEMGDHFIWSTYYPAIVFSAVTGGFFGGLLATFLSSLIAFFGWHYFSGHGFLQDNAGLVGMGVFLVNGLLITLVASWLRKARQRILGASMELEERSAQLQALSDNLPNSFIYQTVTTASGEAQVVYVSNGVSGFIPRSPRDIIRDPALLYDLIAEEDRERFYAFRTAAIRDSTPLNLDVRYRNAAGELRWAHLHSQPRRREDGLIVWDGLFKDITDRKELEAQVVRQQTFTHRLITETTIQEQEREKSLISYHLNEDINQILASVKIHLEMAKRHELKKEELLQSSYEELIQAIGKIKLLYASIDAPSFADLGFYQTIEILLDKTQLTTGLQIQFIYEIPENTPIPDPLMLILYRIIQEQLDNIARHAGTERVVVHIHAEDGRLHLSVLDPADSLAGDPGNWGIGLKRLQGRIEFYGGTMQLSCGAGEGCLLEVQVPLDAAVVSPLVPASHLMQARDRRTWQAE
ncbi:MAG TPA: PAS domain-containing protein [Chitinophagaceae bacterium]|nr:PAS domain-containing protein [Chitinophagaceae bacterium]